MTTSLALVFDLRRGAAGEQRGRRQRVVGLAGQRELHRAGDRRRLRLGGRRPGRAAARLRRALLVRRRGRRAASAASTSYGSGSASEPCRRRDGRRSRTGGPISPRSAARPRRPARPGVRLGRPAGGAAAGRAASRIRCGHPVDRGLGHHQQAEGTEQDEQQHGQRGADPALQRAGGPGRRAGRRRWPGRRGRPASRRRGGTGRRRRAQRDPADADPAALLRLGQLAQQVHAGGRRAAPAGRRAAVPTRAAQQVVRRPGRPDRRRTTRAPTPATTASREHGQAEPVAAVGRVEPGGRPPAGRPRGRRRRPRGRAAASRRTAPGRAARAARRSGAVAGAAAPPGTPPWWRRRALRSGQSRAETSRGLQPDSRNAPGTARPTHRHHHRPGSRASRCRRPGREPPRGTAATPAAPIGRDTVHGVVRVGRSAGDVTAPPWNGGRVRLSG